MARPVDFVSRSGRPTTVGGLTLTPQSQALIVRLPFGGVVWNRPTAVVVEHLGVSQRIPVVDLTRLLQLTLLGLAGVFTLAYLASVRGGQSQRS